MRNVSPTLHRCLAGGAKVEGMQHMQNVTATRGAFARGALRGTIAAAAILSLSAVAQAQAPQLRPATTAAYKFVPSLDAVPRPTVVQGAVQRKVIPFLTPVDPLTFEEMKAQAAVPRGVMQRPGLDSQSPAPMKSGPTVQKGTQYQTVNPPEGSFPGISQQSCINAGGGSWIPSDMALAVGDTQVGVMQAVNNCFSVFDKATGAQQAGYPISSAAFFGIPAGRHPTDPRLLFDWINHRYLFVLINLDDGCPNSPPGCPTPSFYQLAVSSGDDPTGSYCLFQIPSVQGQSGTGNLSWTFPDQPRLGQNRDGVFIAANDYRQGSYIGEEIIALPKGIGGTSGGAGLYSACGTGFGYTTVAPINNGFNIQPASNFSPYDDPKSMYFVTSDFGNSRNQLVLSSFHDPFNIDGQISFTQVRINVTNTYSLPPTASQCNTSTRIDTGDTRISGTAMYAAGSIYAALTTGLSNGTSAIISYQIQPFVDTSGGAADGQITGGRVLNEVVQGNGGSGSNLFWYYPAQQPDPEGNATTVFGFSSPTVCPSVAYLSRRAGQQPGTWPDNGVFAAVGQGSNTSGRWGDYFATAPAGMVSGGGTGGFPKMWFAGQFGSASTDLWNTVIGRTGYNAINQNIPTQTSSR
jgi:hypothetical protein